MILLLPLKVKEYIYVKVRAIKAPEDERIIAATFKIVVSEGEGGTKKSKRRRKNASAFGIEAKKTKNIGICS